MTEEVKAKIKSAKYAAHYISAIQEKVCAKLQLEKYWKCTDIKVYLRETEYEYDSNGWALMVKTYKRMGYDVSLVKYKVLTSNLYAKYGYIVNVKK